MGKNGNGSFWPFHSFLTRGRAELLLNIFIYQDMAKINLNFCELFSLE